MSDVGVQAIVDALEAARQAHVRAELASDYIGGVVSELEAILERVMEAPNGLGTLR